MCLSGTASISSRMFTGLSRKVRKLRSPSQSSPCVLVRWRLQGSESAGLKRMTDERPRRSMHTEAEQMLQEIGRQLDKDIFPRVKNGGIVMPSELAVPSTLGEEKYDEDQRRCTTRPRKGSPGRERSAGRSWPPRQTAPLVRANLQTYYEDELDAIHRAYPGTKVWQQEGTLWLLIESTLLSELRQT